jgi:hypothetical protein
MVALILSLVNINAFKIKNIISNKKSLVLFNSKLELKSLSRKELQTLAKENGIKAITMNLFQKQLLNMVIDMTIPK